MPGQTFYITTPIFYPNGVPHIGHAYTAVATDAIARFHRLDGKDVRFLTGTDEHGLKMQQTALAEGLTPLQLADRNSTRFRDMMAALDVSYDDYIRTTEPRHRAACQAIWERMVAAGDIYLDTYAGWYSVRQEAFFDESETTLGTDGVRREPLGSPVEWVEEESYFFRLSAYGDKLLSCYDKNPTFIEPRERRNEVVSFVRSGLKDLSVSRTAFDWGIPVPGDPKHVMYVWVDALTNYLTGAGFPDQQSELWRYWPASVHIVGKDIIRFHTVYWPAFLLSAGLPLPERVFAHGFLLNRGEKMSKSVGNVADPFELADRYGADSLRYFLLREVPFGQDGSYSHEAIVQRINADLANDLGNLAQRTLTLIARNCDGRVPENRAGKPEDEALLRRARGLVVTVRKQVEDLALHTALAEIWSLVAEANRYIATAEPWVLRKTDPARMAGVLYTTAEAIRIAAILVQPFAPRAAAKLLDLLGVEEGARTLSTIETSPLRPGTSLPAPAPVFPRFVDAAA